MIKAYPDHYGFYIWSEAEGCTVQLTDLTLSHDERTGTYYLSARYRYEDDSGIEDIYIPKILLPIDKHRVTLEKSIHMSFPVCDIGLGPLNLMEDSDGFYMRSKVIEEKVHEVTLDEIEKRLGYKVKIVNSK